MQELPLLEVQLQSAHSGQSHNSQAFVSFNGLSLVPVPLFTYHDAT